MSTSESFSTQQKTVTTISDESSGEFDRFENLTRKLVNVPKSEIDEKRDADKNGNGR